MPSLIRSLFLIFVPGFFASQHAAAQTVIGVDFGQNDNLPMGVASTTGTRREAGFQHFHISRHDTVTYSGAVELTYNVPDLDRTSGLVTVRLQGNPTGAAGSIGGRNRSAPLDNGGFTYGDLLSDGIGRTNLTSTAGEYTLQILGLNPNQEFHLRLWSASNGSDVNTTYSWFDTTFSSRLLGTIFNGPGSPLSATSNNDFSTSGIVTANADGHLLLGLTSSNGSPTAGFINGFMLSAIPEPSLPVLITLSAFAFCLRRRPCAGRTAG